ncbi:4'-phosphopantetheinyl transferase family protein [Novosphingobium terrae]|uniref:4'-phosphopantetheinyl transferase family protein n=1 Tax=Novosphingobium terrae TaxID=2726189 RepID=UPI00198014C7|nr:4'-phosphopantetheinyl transferase superfamily protein [Novosphingobium terrae]
MHSPIFSQDVPVHAASWALDGAGMDSGTAVRLRRLHHPETPGTQWPLKEELWLWLGAEATPLAELPACLSGAEQDRAARFRFEQDRWSYMAAHAGLRLLLGRLLDEAPPSIAFHTLPGGKPVLCPSRYGAHRAAALHFSISHSRGLVAVALSGSPVGVDVERVRLLEDMAQLVARFMAPEALAAFTATTNPQDRMALFYRNWTLGEALVKAHGEGIGEGFGSFAFTQSGPPRLTRTPPGWGPSDRWRLGHDVAGAEHRARAA